jgi:hypothetical protein
MPNPHRSVRGRKTGVPNKVSTARVARALAEGKTLPPDQLLALAERAMAMVERYQPEITDESGAKVPNKDFKEDRYDHWMARAREILTAAAPYYAPRLHAIATEIEHKAEISISQNLNVKMSPQEAMQEYIKLIDAKPL